VEQTRSLSAQELHRRLDDSHQPQELRPLIAQFNALLDRLAVAYQQMEAFNADVAHELNTPLTTLISSCELALRKPRGEAELQEILASNLEDLQRMAGIVADMLFLSHADRGAEARRSHVPSLAALAEEVAEFHEASLQEAQLQVRIEGDAKAAVDERLLRRALSNLLGNATRYGRPGSTVAIEIGVEPATPAAGNGLWAHQHLRLAVRNAGVEIDPQQLPRIFDRFYRAEVARTHADRNHGLGLAIVAAIARMHDGEAFAESAHGATRIGLVLPVR
jgi:two-component system heavy metal sensor histidine kinase CusS